MRVGWLRLGLFFRFKMVRVLKAKTYENFISDFRNTDSALHRLQTLIQALLDISSYIIASLLFFCPVVLYYILLILPCILQRFEEEKLHEKNCSFRFGWKPGIY